MTAPDHMPEAFENSLHETGHPHMERRRLRFTVTRLDGIPLRLRTLLSDTVRTRTWWS